MVIIPNHEESKTKTTLRYHLTPVSMAYTHTHTQDNNCWHACGEIVTLLVGMQNDVVTIENNMDVLGKIKSRTAM